jgi:hypothetical protein
MKKLRNLVGDFGWWVLLTLALPIHVATVVVAFTWYGGWRGVVAGLLSAAIPALPEVFWAVRVALATDSLIHWYVLIVLAYPLLWALWILGGTVFGVERRGRSDRG